MNYLYLVLGGLGALILAIAFPKARDYITSKKVNDALSQEKKDDQKAQQQLQTVDQKLEGTNVEEAKVDQQLQDLKEDKVTNEEVSEFIDLMEKQADGK